MSWFAIRSWVRWSGDADARDVDTQQRWWLTAAVLLALGGAARADVLNFVEQQRRFDPIAVVTSPDGQHVYAAAQAGGGVGVFRRDSTSGALEFVQVQRDGIRGTDENGTVQTVAISADGRHVYVATRFNVVTFSREAISGRLTFVQALGALQDHLPDLDGIEAVSVSPDGRHVYTASYFGNSIGVFRRDVASGVLTVVEFQVNGVNGVECLGRPRAVTVSPDGATVYAASSDCRIGATLVFTREPETGKLVLLEIQKSRDLPIDQFSEYAGLADPYVVVVSPDGNNVYIAGFYDTPVPQAVVYDGIGVFRRDPATGKLTFVQAIFGGKRTQYITKGLRHLRALAVSPDGAHVYTGAEISDAVLLFDRDATTGALTLRDSRFNAMDGIDGLDGVRSVVVSPDGRHLYAAGTQDNSLTLFSRAADTGVLSFAAANRSASAEIKGLDEPRAAAMSPDGTTLYVSSRNDDALEVFQRNTVTGKLLFQQILANGTGGIEGLVNPEGVVVSPDGRHVYAAGYNADAIVAFNRDALSGALTYLRTTVEPLPAQSTNNPIALTFSPDAKHLYVANYGSYANSIAVFSRDAATGALSLVEFVRDGVNGVSGLHQVREIAVSSDGHYVYAVGFNDSALVLFKRNTTSGALTFVEAQVEGVGGVHGLVYPASLALTPDGRYLYVASYATTLEGCCLDGSGAVAVFRRDAGSGRLTFVQALFDAPGGPDAVDGLYSAIAVRVSPDGRYVYVASLNDDGIMTFARDSESGLLTVADRDADDIHADGIQGATGVVVSPDNRFVYVVGLTDDAIAAFAVLGAQQGTPTPSAGIPTVVPSTATHSATASAPPTATLTAAPGSPTSTSTPTNATPAHTPTASAPPTTTRTTTPAHSATSTPSVVATATPSVLPTPPPTATTEPTTSPTSTTSASPTQPPAITPTFTASPAVPVCIGDCTGDRVVTIDELLIGVNIFLGERSIDDCRALDPDYGFDVTIVELISAVRNLLDGCPME